MTSGSRISRRSWTLAFICLGVLMIDMDTTIVAVAAPSISADLRLSSTLLTWLLNGYNLVFGGSLLLGGGLGDTYGKRRVFLLGVLVFTLASGTAGMATSVGLLLSARAVQGFAAALVTAVSLSLIAQIASEPAERAKALGVYGFVCAAGGSIGEILGGLITQTLSWHWIFLVNMPIGLVVYGACERLLPKNVIGLHDRRLDGVGAVAITLAPGLLVYGLLTLGQPGGPLLNTWMALGLSGALLVLFLANERYARNPVLPPRMWALRSFAIANVVTLLWSIGSFSWFVLTALYAQRALRYEPFQVGLIFLPAALTTAVISVAFSARLIVRYGARAVLTSGLLAISVGVALFTRASSGGSFTTDILPGMLLIGIGSGVAFNPLLIAGMRDVHEEHSAVASGAINTAFMIGGAVGLACLAALAESHTRRLTAVGLASTAALVGGYHQAFLVAALVIAAAATTAWVGLREQRMPSHHVSDSRVTEAGA